MSGKKGNLRQENRGIDGQLFLSEIHTVEAVEQEEIAAFIEKEAGRMQAGFDLETGPLVKFGLFKTREGDHLLIIIHHLVVDGVSWRILLEDFTAAYRFLENGETVELPAKVIPFCIGPSVSMSMPVPLPKAGTVRSVRSWISGAAWKQQG